MVILSILKGILSYIATNMDDIVMLTILFARTKWKKGMTPSHIIQGQYAGLIFITIISALFASSLQLIVPKYIKFLGIIPILLGIKIIIDSLLGKSEEAEKDEENVEHSISKKYRFLNPYFIEMFFISLSNGSDNLGIYIPIFSTMSLCSILIIFITFMIMTALWCFIAYKISNNTTIQNITKKYKNIIIPTLFIFIGISILL